MTETTTHDTRPVEPWRPELRVKHAARAADVRRITLCGLSIDRVDLAPWGEWPTCKACVCGALDNRNNRRALGLADKPPPSASGGQP